MLSESLVANLSHCLVAACFAMAASTTYSTSRPAPQPSTVAGYFPAMRSRFDASSVVTDFTRSPDAEWRTPGWLDAQQIKRLQACLTGGIVLIAGVLTKAGMARQRAEAGVLEAAARSAAAAKRAAEQQEQYRAQVAADLAARKEKEATAAIAAAQFSASLAAMTKEALIRVVERLAARHRPSASAAVAAEGGVVSETTALVDFRNDLAAKLSAACEEADEACGDKHHLRDATSGILSCVEDCFHAHWSPSHSVSTQLLMLNELAAHLDFSGGEDRVCDFDGDRVLLLLDGAVEDALAAWNGDDVPHSVLERTVTVFSEAFWAPCQEYGLFYEAPGELKGGKAARAALEGPREDSESGEAASEKEDEDDDDAGGSNSEADDDDDAVGSGSE